jgi:hypothetical protein
MYHMACGEHMAWGYVDQPPLIAVIAWLTRHLLGTSLFAIHVLPALAGFTLVWLTGRIARELGGGPFAQGLASLCTACAGVYLVLHHLFTMNALEPLNWMACAYVVIRIVKTGNQKLWLWFGVLAGIGLENKYSIALFAFSIVVGLLLTKERKALASMDLDCRIDRIPHFCAQLDLKHSTSLALPGIDAKYPSERARYGAHSAWLSAGADLSDDARHISSVGARRAVFFLVEGRKALSRAGLGICRSAHSADRS